MTNLEEIPADAVRVDPKALRQMCTAVLRHLELPVGDAARIAECLVSVDLRGVVSHGTSLLPRYIDEFCTGGLNPRPATRTIRETPLTAVLDGDGGIGYLAATRATEMLIDKARRSGLAIVASRCHGHIGSVGIYARMALEADLVSFSVAGGANWQPPTKEAATIWDAVGSPPICFAMPAAAGPPLVLDMSASFFRERKQLDEACRRFPEAVFKSLGLKFVAALLGGVLAGGVPGAAGVDVGAPSTKYPFARRGFLMVAFRIDSFGEVELFKREVDRILAASRALEPLPGQARAEVAGSREWRREREWAAESIPLGRDHCQMLEEVARLYGLEVPW